MPPVAELPSVEADDPTEAVEAMLAAGRLPAGCQPAMGAGGDAGSRERGADADGPLSSPCRARRADTLELSGERVLVFRHPHGLIVARMLLAAIALIVLAGWWLFTGER
jgi:hypothetical protein